MENVSVEKNIDKSFYLTSELMFLRVNEVMNFMKSIQVGEVKEYEFEDIYFETPTYFLKEINATIRVRKMPEIQTLSIVCNQLGKKREFEIEMEYDSSITDKDEYVLFLEDKIQDIYTHQMDVDVVRVLHQLKPFLYIKTKRKAHQVFNNREFKGEVDFDTTTFKAKRNTNTSFIVEFKNKCYLTKENEETFERFIKDFQKKVVMIPMNEKKLDAGLRTVHQDW